MRKKNEILPQLCYATCGRRKQANKEELKSLVLVSWCGMFLRPSFVHRCACMYALKLTLSGSSKAASTLSRTQTSASSPSPTSTLHIRMSFLDVRTDWSSHHSLIAVTSPSPRHWECQWAGHQLDLQVCLAHDVCKNSCLLY